MRTLHTDQYAAFVTVLVALREKSGLTQRAVADLLRKPQSFVSKYERSERRLDVPEFIAIVRALGADPAKVVAQVEKAMGKAEGG